MDNAATTCEQPASPRNEILEESARSDTFIDRVRNEDIRRALRQDAVLDIVKLVLFADDVMMLAEKSEDMERNLTEMKKAMDNWGMKIHWGKTKVMMVSRIGDDCKVNVDGQDIAQVEKMTYL